MFSKTRPLTITVTVIGLSFLFLVANGCETFVDTPPISTPTPSAIPSATPPAVATVSPPAVPTAVPSALPTAPPAGPGQPNTPVILGRTGNPVITWFTKARTKWASNKADIVLSYQQQNGGWDKNYDYNSIGMGSGGNGRGTFDNGATVTEIVYMAERYAQTQDTRYRISVRNAATFILSAQYTSGGWPQFFPLKNGYWDHVTYNDDAMASILTVLQLAIEKAALFNTDVFSDADRSNFKIAMDKGIDYTLRAQWIQNGVLTVWCAQHGATDYLPKPARAYELESLSGLESVNIVAFLMMQPQTTAIEASVRAALAWFRSPATILEGYVYDSSKSERVVPKVGGKMWYRFYKLDTNKGFFSDRDGGTYYDIMDISQERREGYQWGGTYGDKIDTFAKTVGY